MGVTGRLIRESLLKDLERELGGGENVFLLSFVSVPARRMDGLRRDLKACGAKARVFKNRLARLALEDLDHSDLARLVRQQTIFVWGGEDAAVVCKTLQKFAEEADGVSVQGGLLQGRYAGKQDVDRLAQLPSKDVLRAQLLATILSPVTRFAGILNSKTRDLLSILKQLGEQKGGN